MNSDQSAESNLAEPDSTILETVRMAFESELKSTGSVSIESWLERVPARIKPEMFVRLLQVEVRFCLANGVMLDRGRYCDRFPEFEKQIFSVFAQLSPEASNSSNSISMAATVDQWPVLEPHDRHGGTWRIGDVVGRYRLQTFIARGGFGEVWRGFDPELNRVVAIKVPRADRPCTPERSLMFRDEARRAAMFRHEGIVPVYDVGQVDAGFFIVSEFIDGPTLYQRMQTERIARDEAVRIVRTIALILSKAHLKDLIHRDIKPSNILIRKDGSLAITDFGLAVSEMEQSTLAPDIAGTLIYMSPEQARGETRLLDGRSDLYSLGVILFQLLTGRLPFQSRNQADLLDQIRHREVRPLRSFDDSIPRRLDEICLKCLSKEVRNRYSTGADLAADLESWNRPQATWGKKTVIGLVTIVLAGLLALAVDGGWHRGRGPSQVKPSLTESVPRSDGWQPMLSQPLEKVVSLKRHQTDFILQDEKTNSLTARTDDSYWILATQHSGNAPLRMRGSLHIDKWVGSVGFVWGLSRRPEPYPGRPPRCFACVIERFSETDSLTVSVREFETEESIPEILSISGQTEIATKIIDPIPATSPASLEVAMTEFNIEVRVNGEEVWKLGIENSEVLSKLTTTTGQTGFIVRGSMIVVRDAHVNLAPFVEMK